MVKKTSHQAVEWLFHQAKEFREAAKSEKNPEKQKHLYRASAYFVIQFYCNFLSEMLKLSRASWVREDTPIPAKFSACAPLFKGFKEKTGIQKCLYSIRNHLYHSDKSFPIKRINELNYLINKATDYHTFCTNVMRKRLSIKKTKKGLLEEIQDKIQVMEGWLKYPADSEMGKFVYDFKGTREKYLKKMKPFSELRLGRMSRGNLECLSEMLNGIIIDFSSETHIGLQICEKCGGLIESTQEDTMSYGGNGEDIEPDSFAVELVEKCKKCGTVYGRDLLVHEHL